MLITTKIAFQIFQFELRLRNSYKRLGLIALQRNKRYDINNHVNNVKHSSKVKSVAYIEIRNAWLAQQIKSPFGRQVPN